MPKTASPGSGICCLSLCPCQSLLSQGCADLKLCQEKEAVEVLFFGLLSHSSARGHRRQQQGIWARSCLLPREGEGATLLKLAWHLHTIPEGAGQDLWISPLSRLLVLKVFHSFSRHLMYPRRIFVSSNSPSDCEHCPLSQNFLPWILNWGGFLCPSPLRGHSEFSIAVVYSLAFFFQSSIYLLIQTPLYYWILECQ